MFFKKLNVCLFVLLSSYTCSMWGSQGVMDEEKQVVSLVQPLVQSQKLAGVVVGIVDKNGPRIYSFGSTSLQNGSDLDGQSIFQIASLSKVFTSLLMETLVQQGKVSWNTNISEYLPQPIQLLDPKKPITLLHLSTHSSGFPSLPLNLKPVDSLNPYKDYDLSRLHEFLSSFNPSVSPGEIWGYSNLGVGLLGHIAEKIEHKSYDELVREYIFNPLKMGDTKVFLSSPEKNRCVLGYSSYDFLDASNSDLWRYWVWFKGLFKKKPLRPMKPWDFDVLVGAGGIKSTANDILIFLSHCVSISSTSSPLQEAILDTQKIQTHLPQLQTGCHMAKGWIVLPQKNGDLYWHNGATYSSSSFMGFNTASKKAVVILTNTFTGSQDPDKIGLALLTEKTIK